MTKNKDIIVLTYHNIVGVNRHLYLYDVNLEAFEKQMTYIADLRSSNYDILISFDDGYKSWADDVLRTLKKCSIRAYFFVCIQSLREGLITDRDIITLKNNGMHIGSHAVSHRFLHLLTEQEIDFELRESKKILEDIVQERIDCFSVPRGIYNKKVLTIAQKNGYKYIFTSDVGINKSLDFIVKRIPIKRNITINNFNNIVTGKNKTIKQMVFQQKLKDITKKVLGIKNYNLLRKVIVHRVEY